VLCCVDRWFILLSSQSACWLVTNVTQLAHGINSHEGDGTLLWGTYMLRTNLLVTPTLLIRLMNGSCEASRHHPSSALLLSGRAGGLGAPAEPSTCVARSGIQLECHQLVASEHQPNVALV
jgi:hypothetical protein